MEPPSCSSVAVGLMKMVNIAGTVAALFTALSPDPGTVLSTYGARTRCVVHASVLVNERIIFSAFLQLRGASGKGKCY